MLLFQSLGETTERKKEKTKKKKEKVRGGKKKEEGEEEGGCKQEFAEEEYKGSHHVRKTVKKADNVRTGGRGVYPSSLILTSFYQVLKSLGNGLSTLTN